MCLGQGQGEGPGPWSHLRTTTLDLPHLLGYRSPFLPSHSHPCATLALQVPSLFMPVAFVRFPLSLSGLPPSLACVH